jgi:hypothetical protein
MVNFDKIVNSDDSIDLYDVRNALEEEGFDIDDSIETNGEFKFTADDKTVTISIGKSESRYTSFDIDAGVRNGFISVETDDVQDIVDRVYDLL